MSEWSGFDAGTVSDALDALGLPGSVEGIRGVVSASPMIGPAFTVRYVPASGPRGSVGDFLDDVPEGSVVVIDNGGRTDCTVWGGIMSEVALRRDLAGTAVHGAGRDVGVATRLGYPLYARASFMRTGKDRVQLESVGQLVSVGDCAVAPGDIVMGSVDGLLVVPAARAAEVLDKAHSIRAAEERIVEHVHRGMTLTQARGAEGYHRLQRSER